MRVELKGIFSVELNKPDLPPDPACCCVLMSADIGESNCAGAEQFNFYLVTPSFLVKFPEVRWGHAYLLMPEFDWREAERMLERLVAGIRAEHWDDAVNQLCKYLDWEFDGYRQA